MYEGSIGTQILYIFQIYKTRESIRLFFSFSFSCSVNDVNKNQTNFTISPNTSIRLWASSWKKRQNDGRYRSIIKVSVWNGKFFIAWNYIFSLSNFFIFSPKRYLLDENWNVEIHFYLKTISFFFIELASKFNALAGILQVSFFSSSIFLNLG